jgi:signal peptidase I
VSETETPETHASPDMSFTPTEDGPPRPASGRGRGVVEWVAIVVVALLAAFGIKTWVVQAFVIPSGSMEPTILINDRVLVDKLAYDFHGVHRGNIIVFKKTPADTEAGDINDLIKRVIGLPGQTLRSGPDGQIYVDGKLIAQPWLTPAAQANPGPPICGSAPDLSRTDCVGAVLHLPKGEYYVMGDNRGDSDDSRYWGPVPSNLIVGQAFLRIWPLSRIHWF